VLPLSLECRDRTALKSASHVRCVTYLERCGKASRPPRARLPNRSHARAHGAAFRAFHDRPVQRDRPAVRPLVDLDGAFVPAFRTRHRERGLQVPARASRRRRLDWCFAARSGHSADDRLRTSCSKNTPPGRLTLRYLRRLFEFRAARMAVLLRAKGCIVERRHSGVRTITIVPPSSPYLLAWGRHLPAALCRRLHQPSSDPGQRGEVWGFNSFAGTATATVRVPR
jgi:hypothetical protein